jgi:1-aminocyclopropane-1-carboxylate deaminase/D-cysteine desulfhydrase-like pyridoxal-dependent ACC family enzyme
MTAMRPLSQEFSALEKILPFTELANLPTPIERMQLTLENSKEIKNLWIKRDDKTSALYGGNKVRKMEFIVGDILKRQIKQVVTFGGTGTNHGLATSLYCRLYDVDCTIFLFDQPRTASVETNLGLMKNLGAELKFCGSLLNTALHYYVRRFISRSSVYFLPAGGSSVLGCIAFVNAGFELREQINRGELFEPDYIYCPVGSSGTLAGLTVGCQLAGLKSQVVGVRVAPSHLGIIPICTQATITALIKKTYAYLKKMDASIPDIQLRQPQLLGTFYGPGYGSSTPAADDAIKYFGRAGVNLETTYTAKAAAAVIRCCVENPDQRVLYWHTFNSSDTSKLLAAVESTGSCASTVSSS